jgi:hypothetical protein
MTHLGACQRLDECERTRLVSIGPFQGKCTLLRARVARTMNLHAYPAKDLFRSPGVAFPGGKVASSPEDGVEAARASVERCV